MFPRDVLLLRVIQVIILLKMRSAYQISEERDSEFEHFSNKKDKLTHYNLSLPIIHLKKSISNRFCLMIITFIYLAIIFLCTYTYI